MAALGTAPGGSTQADTALVAYRKPSPLASVTAQGAGRRKSWRRPGFGAIFSDRIAERNWTVSVMRKFPLALPFGLRLDKRGKHADFAEV